MIAMVGTSIGAGNILRTKRVAWTAAALAAAITGCVGFFGIVAPGLWTGFFTDDPGVHAFAAKYLLIAGFAFPFFGVALTLAAAFQAARRPLWPIFGVVTRALVVVAGAWFAIHFVKAGFVGIAVAAAAGLVVYGTSLAIAFRCGTLGAPSKSPSKPS